MLSVKGVSLKQAWETLQLCPQETMPHALPLWIPQDTPTQETSPRFMICNLSLLNECWHNANEYLIKIVISIKVIRVQHAVPYIS